MTDEATNPQANTDRELWREREGDFYADSIHVTAQGSIGATLIARERDTDDARLLDWLETMALDVWLPTRDGLLGLFRAGPNEDETLRAKIRAAIALSREAPAVEAPPKLNSYGDHEDEAFRAVLAIAETETLPASYDAKWVQNLCRALYAKLAQRIAAAATERNAPTPKPLPCYWPKCLCTNTATCEHRQYPVAAPASVEHPPAEAQQSAAPSPAPAAEPTGDAK